MPGIWVALLCASGAAAATAAWAILLSATPSIDLLRCAFLGAGLVSGLSFGVYPLHEPPTLVASTAAGALLLLYQCLIHASVSKGGPAMQALINCNIALITLYKCREPVSVLLSLGLVFSAAALSLRMHTQPAVES